MRGNVRSSTNMLYPDCQDVYSLSLKKQCVTLWEKRLEKHVIQRIKIKISHNEYQHKAQMNIKKATKVISVSFIRWAGNLSQSYNAHAREEDLKKKKNNKRKKQKQKMNIWSPS